MSDASDRVAEHQFFLDEFRHRTLLISVENPEEEQRAAERELLRVVQTLLANETRILLISSGEGALGPDEIGEVLGVGTTDNLDPTGLGDLDPLAGLWIDLADHGVAVVDAGEENRGQVGVFSAHLASRLRADKLVLTDPQGGWGSPTTSFIDLAHDRKSLAGDRPRVARAVQLALSAEVSSVNLCRLENLGEELFTFDGAGTLFTRDSYLKVSRLSLDDLPMVEELVGRGVAEGFLRPRSRTEVVKIALNGMGARVAGSGQLAAIGSLGTDQYRGDNVGEVTCLYTVNRFSGEGAAGRLVEQLDSAAAETGLRAVFACTISDRAARFFERHGFVEQAQSRVPTSKWNDYDRERRERIRVLWRDLEGDT